MTLPPQLGSYTLERGLGKGGSSEVWLARHTYLQDYRVAIKILMSQDAEAVRRFQREAMLASRLRHPSIVQFHDFGYSQPFFFTVLDYVEGSSLREVLARRHHLPLSEALPLLINIAAALDYAHSQNIVHRDVTPANILVEGASRRAFLTDFGIARDSSGQPITAISSIMGTKGYLSPEASRSAASVTHRSDIFSLGIVLYEMLSGELPWENLPPEGDLAAFAARISLLDRAIAGLPPEVDRVLALMLAVDPAQRYPTAQAAVEELRQILAHHENTTQVLSPRRAATVPPPIALQSSGVSPNEVERLLSPDLAGPVIARAHRRADELGNPTTLTTLLDAWSAEQFLRRPLLGRLARFHKVTSHNVYFYRLNVLYEQRGDPEEAEEPDYKAEAFGLEPELDPWEVILPTPEEFKDEVGARVRLPGSTRIATCSTCQGRGSTTCPHCNGRQRVIEHRPVPGSAQRPRGKQAPAEPPQTQAVLVPCPTCSGRGGITCERCDGVARVIQHKTLAWERHPRIFKAQDDLPALDEDWLNRTCKSERVYHERYHNGLRPEWRFVSVIDELVQLAEAEAGDQQQIVMSELTIDLIPVTDVVFDLGQADQDKLYKVSVYGFENLIPPDKRFLNRERIGGIIAIAVLTLMLIILFGVMMLR